MCPFTLFMRVKSFATLNTYYTRKLCASQPVLYVDKFTMFTVPQKEKKMFSVIKKVKLTCYYY